MENIIEVKNLSFSYQSNQRVLDDISFNIKKGSYTVLLGHNGSGKSTIAKLLIGLLGKENGDINISGYQLNLENLYKVREKIGIVFQNPDNQFIGSTVRDDIAFGLENMCVPHEEMDAIITKYASKVGMLDFLDHEPTKLSGGQKQRVAIAGIMAMSPSIIILDEATSMLDPIGKREINSLIKELNKEKDITIISITHDIEEATKADEVILLNQGKIEKTGNPTAVLSNQKLLNKLKLDIPFSLKITKGLKEKGISLKETTSYEEMVKELCQLTLKK
ncbi:MAG: energy-coupling factor transporter ATPase [Thomasclavelia sp.]|jgi:energy-coupling factor transport system ATP-binding protein|nr:energy-coupling factor transporter ATPase [Thomasclavelia sp.]